MSRVWHVFLVAQIFALFWTLPIGVLGSRQHCRLRVHRRYTGQAVFNPPTSSVSNGDQPTNGPTPTAAPSSGEPAQPTSTLAPLPPFVYGSNPIRAVNLGGWLVLEPWITPSFFERTNNTEVIDEFTLGSLIDREVALKMLTQHWETWITEQDFVDIRAAGLTHVRIPLGFWSIPIPRGEQRTDVSPDPYLPGAWSYLLRGLDWARKHGLRVVVDIHGAPGSQNGYDNSGQRTSDPQWALDEDFVTHTIDVVRYLVANTGGLIEVLELLNEPAGFRGEEWANVIRQYWLNGYDAVREAAGNNTRVMISDAFLGVNSWTSFLTSPRGEGVMMDFHEYQIFSHLELERSMQEHIDYACGYIDSLGSFTSSNIWTVLGEWSNAMTDCARWLNGRGVGARWDGTWFNTDQSHGSCEGYTGSYEGFSDEYKTFLRRYWEVQVEVGESIQGWIFWTWKAENADEWSYQKGLEGGWIPQDPTDRLYPDICSRS
ncbi:glycoside hydrolase family 5 protein [Coprinopsis sp. MPI-PUGE-AT-0042]|nr:glycoside hydrolase family 5 protein [Coprinopsis sp. MPI-PUGE-AT-0042]